MPAAALRIALTLLYPSPLRLSGPYFRAAGSKWPHLNYDSPHFFCDNFVPLCEDILDQVACPVENRVSWACGSPTNASVPRTLNYYNASCYCTDPWIPADYTPARLTELLFDNRAKGTSAWHLLPWASTKFDVRASYAAFCYTALYRLGCSPSLMKINTTLSGTASWVCTCGQFTTGSKRAYVDLVDKLADLSLQELPVFEDPLYLSATLSVGIMVLLGKAGSVLASSLGLPPVVGFLLAGMGMQDIIYRELIKGASANPGSTAHCLTAAVASRASQARPSWPPSSSARRARWLWSSCSCAQG